MTDEERQKYKDYQKNYRKKLSNKIIQHGNDDNHRNIFMVLNNHRNIFMMLDNH